MIPSLIKIFFCLWVLHIKIFQKKLQNASCSIMEAITFGWLARWDVKYEWSYSNLDESLDYEVMVVWYSPSRILMIFKTNNHFLLVVKYFLVKVHIFWGGHKMLRNLHRRFDWHYKVHRTNLRWRFRKILWPSQNI